MVCNENKVVYCQGIGARSRGGGQVGADVAAVRHHRPRHRARPDHARARRQDTTGHRQYREGQDGPGVSSTDLP